MAPQVAVSVSTLAGSNVDLQLGADASVRQAKEAASQDLGRPADLQRWLVGGTIVEDGELLSSVLQSDSSVLCVFIPRTFEVLVTVIAWSQGTEAEYARDVRVNISPSLTIEAVKYEIASQCGLPPGTSIRASRLIKAGLHMDDAKTVEQYHLDPNAKLHFVVPRGVMASSTFPSGANATIVPSDHIVDATTFEEFYGLSKEKKNEKCIDKGHPQSEKVDGSSEKKSDAQQAAEMFHTMGRYPLRPRSVKARRSSSVPAKRTSLGGEGDADVLDAPAVAEPGTIEALLAAVHRSGRCVPTNASNPVERPMPARANDESVKPSPANGDIAPASPARIGRPPRPPSRPSTQSAGTEKPSTQHASIERPPRCPTQRSTFERPPTQRALVERPSTQCSDDMFSSNFTSFVEWSSREQADTLQAARVRPGDQLCTQRDFFSPNNNVARSASVSAGIDRWSHVSRC